MATYHVTFTPKPRLLQLESGADLHGVEVKFSEAGFLNGVLVLPDDPAEAEARLRELEAQGEIEANFRPEKKLLPMGMPMSPAVLAVWQQGDSFLGIGVTPATQRRGHGGAGVNVVVLDTEIDGDHPQLARMRAEGRLQGDITHRDQSHGTHVVTTITGDLGIAPEVTLLHLNVLPGGSGSESVIAQGYQRARQAGAQIISASLGGAGRSGVIADAVRACNEAQILTVAAAGNGYSRDPVGDPARSSHFCVMGYDRSDPALHADFTDGRRPTDLTLPRVSRPSVGIVAGVPGGGTFAMQGTSMAAPHQTGWLALLLGAA